MAVEKKDGQESAPIEIEIDLDVKDDAKPPKGKTEVEIEHQTPDLKTVEADAPTKETKEDKTKETVTTVVADDPDSLDPPENMDPETRKKWGERARKRFNRLTKQRHEANARIQELEAEIAEERKQRANLTKQNDYSLFNAWHQAEARIKNELEVAKIELKRATNDADVDGQSSAMEKLTKAQVDLEHAVRNRTIAENKVKQYQQDNQQRREQDDEPPQRKPVHRAQGPSEKAMAWGEKHQSWFKKDAVMTAAALAISNELLEDGVDPQTDDYFNELDSRLRSEFPQKFKTKAAASDTPPPVAGPTRAPGTPQKGKMKVVLNERQQKLASRLGLTYEQYARELVRMNGGQ